MNFEKVEKCRVTTGAWATKTGNDFGFFFIPTRWHSAPLKVMVSPGEGEYPWEHVSVSLPDRCPTWEEMHFVKTLFWSDEECVVQYHPPKEDYVSNCKWCLHLWKWTAGDFPRPPSILVGDQTLGEM